MKPAATIWMPFLARWPRVLISRLAVVEFRYLLQRRRRATEIEAAYGQAALADFGENVRGGFFRIEPLADRHAVVAHGLLERLPDHPLRTLNGLQLAVAQGAGASGLATADRAMARAAGALGIGS